MQLIVLLLFSVAGCLISLLKMLVLLPGVSLKGCSEVKLLASPFEVLHSRLIAPAQDWSS